MIMATREELHKMCDSTNTARKGIDYLVDEYYIKTLGWPEDKAIDYAMSLFHDGAITQIKLIGKDGEEIK